MRENILKAPRCSFGAFLVYILNPRQSWIPNNLLMINKCCRKLQSHILVFGVVVWLFLLISIILRFKNLLLSHFLTKADSLSLNSSIFNIETCFLLVWIPQPTKARFKFPTPPSRHRWQSNSQGEGEIGEIMYWCLELISTLQWNVWQLESRIINQWWSWQLIAKKRCNIYCN